MPGWLCKIWKIFANLIGKVVDLIMAVVKDLVDMAIDAIGALLSAAGGWLSSPIVWIAAGLALWYFLGKNKDDPQDDSAVATYGPSDTQPFGVPALSDGTSTGRPGGSV